MASREKATKNVEERLYKSYQKIRKNARNGLAVVNVKRNACGGCFNVVPPQRQAEVREKKKIIVCEHCGRIFADVEDLPVEEEKPKKSRRTVKKRS
jgi:predicted  nucleic acid-binding Zn-ribbon protein